MRILLVEDDKNLIKALKVALKEANYLVEVATDGEMAWEMLKVATYDIVVLDVVLPKLDGITLCRQLREQNIQIPILLLTAQTGIADKLSGLDSGADDYVVKPFHMEELLARLRVLARRQGEPSPTIYRVGQLCLNPQSLDVTFDGQLIPLSRKEYLLLELFMRYPSRVFSRAYIVERLWSLEDLPTEDTVKSHIKRIRQKLAQVGAEDLIETLYGHGYRINPAFARPESASRPIASSPENQINQAIAQLWPSLQPAVLEEVNQLHQILSTVPTKQVEGDWCEAARPIAHKLAGSLGTFGFEAASLTARAIELLLQSSSEEPEIIPVLLQLVAIVQAELNQPHPAATSVEPSRAQATLPDPVPAEDIRILAVDDDPVMLSLVQELLATQNLQVMTLQDSTQVWSELEKLQPNLLIVDLNMPGLNGLELCRAIRNNSRWNWMPILFLTVQRDRETVRKIFEAGADDYVSKPVKAEELTTRILNRLKRQHALKSPI